MIKIFRYLMLATTLILCGCNRAEHNDSSQIYVSITPLKSLVEQITCDDLSVGVIVPAGASVESYELTPRQLIAINNSQIILSTGLLEFEQVILKKISNRERIRDLSNGVELIEGSCSHDHHHGSSHAHGIDPHIWTSPKELRMMVRRCFEAVNKIYPDSTKYRTAYQKLDRELKQLDDECRRKISASGIASIFIYHPALTYYARSYGIEQVAIESEGKEPSVKRIAEMIERGGREGIRCILYQAEYPRSSVDIVAKDIGAEAIMIDPLSEDVVGEIRSITDIIVKR